MRDASTDGIQLGGRPATPRPTRDHPTVVGQSRPELSEIGYEAAVIVISHPENRRLGARYRLAPGATLEFGRAPELDVSLPEVPSLSRHHARLRFRHGRVTLDDLGSRNGSFVNDRAVHGSVEMRSGDRFQLGNVHFKFLHERDVEHAYYEAIYEMVARDGLTGIFNRRKLYEEGARELARASRHGRSLSLVMIDLDHFKRVNDAHGHLGGDAALKQVTSRLASLIRTEELFARLGGEEFAVLCPEMGLEDALLLAERLRRLCGGEPYDCAGEPERITCSIGVATLGPEMSRIEDLLRAADRALYVAKNGGRDRVEAAAPA